MKAIRKLLSSEWSRGTLRIHTVLELSVNGQNGCNKDKKEIALDSYHEFINKSIGFVSIQIRMSAN